MLIFDFLFNLGVGKSQLAVELAQALNGEIINADAMQCYKGFDSFKLKVLIFVQTKWQLKKKDLLNII